MKMCKKKSFSKLTLRTAIEFKFKSLVNEIKYKLNESQIDWVIYKPKPLNKTTFNIEPKFL